MLVKSIVVVLECCGVVVRGCFGWSERWFLLAGLQYGVNVELDELLEEFILLESVGGLRTTRQRTTQGNKVKDENSVWGNNEPFTRCDKESKND
jgi:hypothetical protein